MVVNHFEPGTIFLSFLFTATCLYVSSLLSFSFSPSLRYNITHSSNCHFSMLRAQSFFLFFKSYLQFYPSRKALVIKTHAFTIIINLNSFFTNPNINRQQRDKSITKSSLSGVFLPFFFFFPYNMLQFFICSFFSFFSFLSLVCSFFFFFFFAGIFLNFLSFALQMLYSFCLWPLRGSSI